MMIMAQAVIIRGGGGGGRTRRCGGRERKKNMNRNEQSGEKKRRERIPEGGARGRTGWPHGLEYLLWVFFFSFFCGAPPSRPTLSKPAVALKKKKKVRAYYRRDVEIM